jgi:Exonuclease
MFQDTISLAAMADALSLSPDYRVLRRLCPRSPSAPLGGQDVRTAVLLDTETTGLDAQKREVIELGMVKFDYLSDGRIAGVRDTFSGFDEPSAPIPPEVTALTGIRHFKMASRKPRKIRPFCAPGFAGVAPGCSPKAPSIWHMRPFTGNISAFKGRSQPVDATQALNLSAGVSNCKVSRGRSFSKITRHLLSRRIGRLFLRRRAPRETMEVDQPASRRNGCTNSSGGRRKTLR